MFALKEAAQYLQEPRWFDWCWLGRLVWYFCDTGSYAMHLQHSGNTEEVIAYSDADWAGCTDTRRSTSCCLIFWGDVLLHAHSRTQVQIGLSSPESEFYGCCGAAAELLYYKGLLNFLGYATKGRLMMDASSAIAIATRSGVGSVRHLAARYLWVQREVQSNSFSVEKVAGPRNPADLGTKHVDVKVLKFCRDFVGLKAAHLDQQEEQEAKNMVNNIFTGLMLLPATKRHSILKLLVTASTLATAKGYETRLLDSYDMTPVKLETQSYLSYKMVIAFFFGQVILGFVFVLGWLLRGWMTTATSTTVILLSPPSCEKSTMTDAVSEPLRTRRVVILYKDSDVFHHPTCKHVNEWQGRHGRRAPSYRTCLRCGSVS